MNWLKSFFPSNRESKIYPSDLHYACGEDGSIEQLKKLLESKPNLSLSSNGLSEFSDALKRFNVDPTIKDKHGKLYLM